MKKVFINNIPLILCKDFNKVPQKYKNNKALLARYSGKSKSLLNYVDNLEKKNTYSAIILSHTDEKKLWTSFKKLFKTIRASGGLVTNEENKVLMIYRRGSWDLPKGKIDKGEGKKKAALREVEEETAAKSLVINNKLVNTYHIYKDQKGQRILKKTFWYKMTAPNQILFPQEEEDIEKALWMDFDKFSIESEPIYPNILEVIDFWRNLG